MKISFRRKIPCMKLETLFVKNLLPSLLEPVYRQLGLTELFPPQAAAIEHGVLEGKNVLLAVPTAAGKTLIAEFCMLKSILEQESRCIYIVPLKALASEKFEDFRSRYSTLGVRVGISTGDLDSPERNLGRYHILIATAEKVDSLLRARASWLLNGLKVVVFDEIHFINDGSRGPTLEILAARIKHLNPEAQLLALSATVNNAKAMAQWLSAECVESTWRPIPLKEGVYFNQQIKWQHGPARLVREEPEEDLGKLVVDTLRSRGQLLVFVNSRRSAQAASRELCGVVAQTLTPEEKKELAAIAKDVIGSEASATKICRKLGEVVRHGSAFHHAGLKPQQRKLIEDSFKKNIIKVICSTPTLAAGVNLPARRAIIRDIKRFESGLGSSYIPVSEYKQCAGRAGRPKYDKYGEAVIIAKSLSESQLLMDRYIHASAEPVISKLGNPAALRIHVLASVAGGYLHDVKETIEFFGHTFFAHQRQTNQLIETIGEVFEFLEREGFLEKAGFRFIATPFGQATSRLYIDPFSAIVLRLGLKKIAAGKSYSDVGILHLLCCCPDTPLLNVGKNDAEALEGFAVRNEDHFIVSHEDFPQLEDYFTNLSILKTVFLFWHWIEEEKEESICDQFNLGPGDIYRHVENAHWLIHAAMVFAELLGFKKLTFSLGDLKNRVQYGIREELLALVKLKGIGRVRARNLFTKGYHKPKDLKYADIDSLAQINQIGKTLAKDIIAQVSTGKVDKEAVKEFAQRFSGKA
jgi:helicase